jgi:hypothetical protein
MAVTKTYEALKKSIVISTVVDLKDMQKKEHSGLIV